MEANEISRLEKNFRKLPGVGYKTALRYAYRIVDMPDSDVEEFISAIRSVKENVKLCPICGAYMENGRCEFCETRDKSVICVVKEPKDIWSIEKLGTFSGVYHVLHNTLDFQKGIGVDDIRLKELISRLSGVSEVILATNPDVSGELTATFIANTLKPLGVKVTRLSCGIPMGAELEYTDEVTLGKAFEERKQI